MIEELYIQDCLNKFTSEYRHRNITIIRYCIEKNRVEVELVRGLTKVMASLAQTQFLYALYTTYGIRPSFQELIKVDGESYKLKAGLFKLEV